MKTAIYQAGYGILGVGNDLEDAIDVANEYLDANSKLDIETIETAYLGEIDGNIYQAGITDNLAAEVERVGGNIVFEKRNGILMTEAEYASEEVND